MCIIDPDHAITDRALGPGLIVTCGANAEYPHPVRMRPVADSTARKSLLKPPAPIDLLAREIRRA